MIGLYGVCDFCPPLEHVPATHRYVDRRTGQVYDLCERHDGPIGRWRNTQRAPV